MLGLLKVHPQYRPIREPNPELRHQHALAGQHLEAGQRTAPEDLLRVTGALLDRLTHRVHIIEANGPSYRLAEAKRRLKRRAEPAPDST